ncbi:MAG TPA: hypothetical protein VFG54_00970 [Prolixibacteraceae bacterium]|nr:hypothetical protein [Prolixibacteraceae bacterium]
MKQFTESRPLRYLLYTLAVMPLFLLRDFSLDNELRYLSIADEALARGTLFTFTNHGILYADKPPLYLWIVMLGKLLLGTHSMLFLGLFSFVPALMILYTMDQWTRKYLSPPERVTAELLLLTSGFFFGTAIVLRMDMLMSLFIVWALYIFYRGYKGQARREDLLLFPLCLFMALFTKGPLGLLIPLLSTSVFLFIRKEVNTLGRYWGWKTWAILFTLSALWFLGVYAEGGSAYLQNLLVHQTVGRAVNSFHHSEPFYYYLPALLYSLAPWSLLVIGVLFMGLKKKLFTSDRELLFLSTALSTLTALSFFSSKLQVYLVPTFPFFIFLTLLWLKRLGWPHKAYVLIMIPAVILCLILPGAALWPLLADDFTPLLLPAALILSLTGILTLAYLRHHSMNRAIQAMASGVLLAVFLASFAIPGYNHLIGMSELSEKAKEISMQKGAANYYYCRITRADNLDVYLGKELKELHIKDLYQSQEKIKKPAILFIAARIVNRSDPMQRYVQGRPMHRTGKYYCVEIDH